MSSVSAWSGTSGGGHHRARVLPGPAEEYAVQRQISHAVRPRPGSRSLGLRRGRGRWLDHVRGRARLPPHRRPGRGGATAWAQDPLGTGRPGGRRSRRPARYADRRDAPPRPRGRRRDPGADAQAARAALRLAVPLPPPRPGTRPPARRQRHLGARGRPPPQSGAPHPRPGRPAPPPIRGRCRRHLHPDQLRRAAGRRHGPAGDAPLLGPPPSGTGGGPRGAGAGRARTWASGRLLAPGSTGCPPR
jgi:hypothetical protein